MGDFHTDYPLLDCVTVCSFVKDHSVDYIAFVQGIIVSLNLCVVSMFFY